ncbi:hypothetical protein BASA81_000183 [Batrachochytrium salamandrivorans]|nr:hypothetical protein BASA81_000183 [Batrachochytrium salamandrivorans]
MNPPLQNCGGENLVLEKWQALGRPRLESNENGDSFAALPVLLVLLSWYLAQRQWRFASGVVFSLLVVLQGPSVWFMLGWPLFALNAKSVWFALGHLASVCGLIWVLGIPTFDWQVRDLRPNIAVWQTFQPFPELVHVFTSVLFLFAHSEFLITSVSRQTLWPCLLVLVATTTFLQPLMLHLWLENAGGNANYYYFQGLISNGMMGILLAQFYLPSPWSPGTWCSEESSGLLANLKQSK